MSAADPSAFLHTPPSFVGITLLHKFVPAAKSIALLVNPANPRAAEAQANELKAAVHALGLELTLVNASNAIEIEEAFSVLVRDRVDALQIGGDPQFGNHIDQLVALATRQKVPTIYPWREFTAAGRPHELWVEHPRCLPSGRSLHRADFERRKA
jgi:ABC-type uncharacterized transport system substrate-binding protein